jgi:hypothetical protein
MRSAKLLFLPFVLMAGAALAQNNSVLPAGTDIKVRTDGPIPSKPAPDATFNATVSNDVVNSSGAMVIPRGSRAELVAIPKENSSDTTLDLRSVIVNGDNYLLQTRSSKGSAPGGLGANKRTGKYVGGGAAIGAVLGAILGGGKGAAIGAVLGGAGGAGAQVYTGKNKEIPAETELTYKLATDLEMRDMGPPSNRGLQQRPPDNR